MFNNIEENEVRTMVDPNSRSDPKLQELIKVMLSQLFKMSSSRGLGCNINSQSDVHILVAICFYNEKILVWVNVGMLNC